jgi:hypothetical protein
VYTGPRRSCWYTASRTALAIAGPDEIRAHLAFCSAFSRVRQVGELLEAAAPQSHRRSSHSRGRSWRRLRGRSALRVALGADSDTRELESTPRGVSVPVRRFDRVLRGRLRAAAGRPPLASAPRPSRVTFRNAGRTRAEVPAPSMISGLAASQSGWNDTWRQRREDGDLLDGRLARLLHRRA